MFSRLAGAAILLSGLILFSGCAGMKGGGGNTVQLNDAKSLKVIIPNGPGVTDNHFTKVAFGKKMLEREKSVLVTNAASSNIAKQVFIRPKKKDANSFEIEKSIDNGDFPGSGLIYTLGYTVSNDGTNTFVEMKPIKYRTYQHGLISFDVPPFSEDELFDYLSNHLVGFKFEVDSNNNIESIYQNLGKYDRDVRKKSEKDPITGIIFKNRYAIPYKGKTVQFSLQPFSKIGGTRVVIYINIPGYYTPGNDVDFNPLLNDIKAKLESIINS